MFEKILCPTDFSDVSRKALDFIRQLKAFGVKEVVILHVIDEREIQSILSHGEGGLDYEEKLEEALQENAREQIKMIETPLKESGFKVKVRIEKGIPFREILRVEGEEDVSITVVGSHGKSCVEEMLLGSVSEKVVRKSSKPVLVVRR